uniref:Reverse transcriptase zinc-binding domain-containing protein n=1 Tax=Leptobrachium leishanense TaxID=445787 RepID=A0A8C5N3K1_9ANUR
MELYYSAALFLRLSDWCMSPPHKLWVPIEQKSLRIPITSLLWQTAPPPELITLCTPSLFPTLLKWRALRKSLSLSTHPSPLLPITFNPLFPAGMSNDFLPTLVEGPYLPLYKCLVDSKPIPKLLLLQDESATSISDYRYYQLRHFIALLGHPTSLRQDESPFETLCTADPHQPHMLSTIYGTLLDASAPLLPLYATRWSREMGDLIPEDKWDMIFQIAAHSSRSLHVQQSHYKFLSRWYLTPSRLHKMYPTSDVLCWRCKKEPGTYLHIWWECSHIRTYWTSIFTKISEIMGLDLLPSPQVALFHLLPLSPVTYRKSLAIHLFNKAKSLIPRHWRSAHTPTITEWIKAVDNIREIEEMYFSIDNNYDKYFATWYRWTDYLSKRPCQPLTPGSKDTSR